MCYFCPLVKGWAGIGLQEKYLSPVRVRILACSEKRLVLDVLTKGSLNVWYNDRLVRMVIDQPEQMILTK